MQQRGTIRYFDPVGGYGLIIPADGSRDVYFRDADIGTGSQPVRVGHPVTFHPVSGKRAAADHAANVRTVDAD